MNPGFLIFLVLHSIVPAICVALYGASPLWLLSGILLTVATFFTVQLSAASAIKIVLCFVSGLAMFFTLMLGASYYMQGTGFNDQYFYHLDFSTLPVAMSAYGRAFIPAILCLLLAFFAPLVFYRRPEQRHGGPLAASLLWLGAAALSYPVHSLVAYRLGVSDAMSGMMPEVPGRLSASKQPASGTGDPYRIATGAVEAKQKNIIFIYAEGLEQTYFDQDVFGDLLPNLRDLSKSAHRFTNVYQTSGTGWTMAGIVASQCGFPLVVSNHLASNSTIASIDKPFETETCLADILKQRGYRTLFMGGASLEFAGKGNFLRTHGYERVLGKDELMPLLPDPRYRNGWGLHDDSLLGLALEELESLERTGEPYLLTLLTLGTHHPDGMVAKTCEPLAEPSDSMSKAIFCTDQLIGRFIREVMKKVDMNHTIVVLFSDHLAMRNTLADKLRENADRRRLAWMVFDNRPGTTSDQVATHFDVGPTTLQMAGITDHPDLGQGLALLGPHKPRIASAPPAADHSGAPKPLASDRSVWESGFGVSYEDLTITVGDLEIKANKQGSEFKRGLFLLVLDDDGYVEDSIWSDDFARLQSELDSRYVVGLSIHRPKREYPDQLFFGRLTQDLSDLRVQVLTSDVLVSAADLRF